MDLGEHRHPDDRAAPHDWGGLGTGTDIPRSSTICNVPGCPNLRPCAVEGHTRKAWEGSTRRTELPADWPQRRAQVLERDPVCTLGLVCGGIALSVECHHVGDKHNHALDALAGVCRACHKAATSQQAADARRHV